MSTIPGGEQASWRPPTAIEVFRARFPAPNITLPEPLSTPEVRQAYFGEGFSMHAQHGLAAVELVHQALSRVVGVNGDRELAHIFRGGPEDYETLYELRRVLHGVVTEAISYAFTAGFEAATPQTEPHD